VTSSMRVVVCDAAIQKSDRRAASRRSSARTDEAVSAYRAVLLTNVGLLDLRL